MAYSMLATLPPINGIYMSVFPILMYTIFGTSKHLTIGKNIFFIFYVNSVNARSIRHAGLSELHLYRHAGCDRVRKKYFFKSKPVWPQKILLLSKFPPKNVSVEAILNKKIFFGHTGMPWKKNFFLITVGMPVYANFT